MPLSSALTVVKKLVKAGHIAYFAGGWVRDYLMRHPSDDIDIVTSATLEQIQALFPKTIPVGIAFGITIVVEEGHQFEVATFRKEGGYADGRRPTSIVSATPQEDALRRDFTINGMFWDPIGKQLFDYVGGQADLKQGIIRAIGNPYERFFEDRLRMMRAVRYATRFNFPIEAKTKQAIVDHAPLLLPAVAIERIWQEFKKMAQFGHLDKAVMLLQELHLLETIFPQLNSLSKAEIENRMRFLSLLPKHAPLIAQLLELFTDNSLEQLLELCNYLKLAKVEKELVDFLHHARELFTMPKEWLEKMEKAEWAHFYAHPDASLAIQIHAAHLPASEQSFFLQAHAKQREILKHPIARIVSKKPLISAAALMQVGIAPGKNMGLLLKEAERISINLDNENPDQIIALLKKSPLWYS